jgi:hypothetical protein
LERFQEFPFIQAGMVIATIALVWMGLSIPVCARKGAATGRAVLRAGVWALLGGIAAVLAWAWLSGQLERFGSVLGLWELLQFSVFVAMFEFIVYFVADRYIRDAQADEADARSAEREVETDA